MQIVTSPTHGALELGEALAVHSTRGARSTVRRANSDLELQRPITAQHDGHRTEPQHHSSQEQACSMSNEAAIRASIGDAVDGDESASDDESDGGESESDDEDSFNDVLLQQLHSIGARTLNVANSVPLTRKLCNKLTKSLLK